MVLRMKGKLKIMNVIIVSGLSGSGKTVVLNTLEDLGYYCIDNMNPQILKIIFKIILNMIKSYLIKLHLV